MKSYRIILIVIAFLSICFVQQTYSQSSASDSSFHPYRVNYWITCPIIGVGMVTNYLGIPLTLHKKDLSLLEIQSLNRNIINFIDDWSLKQDPSQMGTYENYSNYVLISGVVLPALLLFDKKIRQDWGDVLLLYLETMSITPNIYEWSFLGPNFQNRVRPVAYYYDPQNAELTYDKLKTGNNRNSFYSGHVASLSASTFFMVKVYSDYNPEIGNNKYLLYGAATIPPLILGYCRVKALKHFPSDVVVGLAVGALCGILIPEFHRLEDKNINLGLYTSPESTGIALKWQPDFLK